MNGETSVDHLQCQTDRPVPNEQHRRAEELLLKHEDDELVLIVLYCFG